MAGPDTLEIKILISGKSWQRLAMIILLAALNLSCSPSVTDGDTIRCGEERIRLLGIDAPELGGKCRPGRVCVAGDPKASKANLVRLMKVGPYKIERVGTDRYGRTLALVTAGGVDVGCAQIRAGQAVYVAKWDKGGRVRKACAIQQMAENPTTF